MFAQLFLSLNEETFHFIFVTQYEYKYFSWYGVHWVSPIANNKMRKYRSDTAKDKCTFVWTPVYSRITPRWFHGDGLTLYLHVCAPSQLRLQEVARAAVSWQGPIAIVYKQSCHCKLNSTYGVSSWGSKVRARTQAANWFIASDEGRSLICLILKALLPDFISANQEEYRLMFQYITKSETKSQLLND